MNLDLESAHHGMQDGWEPNWLQPSQQLATPWSRHLHETDPLCNRSSLQQPWTSLHDGKECPQLMFQSTSSVSGICRYHLHGNGILCPIGCSGKSKLERILRRYQWLTKIIILWKVDCRWPFWRHVYDVSLLAEDLSLGLNLALAVERYLSICHPLISVKQPDFKKVWMFH